MIIIEKKFCKDAHFQQMNWFGVQRSSRTWMMNIIWEFYASPIALSRCEPWVRWPRCVASARDVARITGSDLAALRWQMKTHWALVRKALSDGRDYIQSYDCGKWMRRGGSIWHVNGTKWAAQECNPCSKQTKTFSYIFFFLFGVRGSGGWSGWARMAVGCGLSLAG